MHWRDWWSPKLHSLSTQVGEWTCKVISQLQLPFVQIHPGHGGQEVLPQAVHGENRWSQRHVTGLHRPFAVPHRKKTQGRGLCYTHNLPCTVEAAWFPLTLEKKRATHLQISYVLVDLYLLPPLNPNLPGSIVVDGPSALRSPEAIQLLKATPTCLMTCHMTHLSSAACIQRNNEACPGPNVP